MIAWTEQQGMIRDMIRDFVEKEIVPHIDDLEYNGLPPYDILRKLFSTFGMDELANTRFDKQIAREEAQAAGKTVDASDNINRGEQQRSLYRSARRRGDGHTADCRDKPSVPGPHHRDGGIRWPDRRRHYVQGQSGAKEKIRTGPAYPEKGRRLGHYGTQLRLRRVWRHEVHRTQGRQWRLHTQRQ